MGKVSYQEYLIESLKDPVEAAGYLNAALEGGDIHVFLEALKNVIEAQGGLSFLAKKTHKSRTSLYKALSATGNPYLKSTNEILSAIGLQLCIQAKIASTGKNRYHAHPH
jgi:probable addiction module antidote protein